MTEIAGVSITKLKEQYQTPLYIYDEDHIRKQCQLFKSKFTHPIVKSEVIYASKAFLTVGMAQLIAQEGLFLDCVSQGEVYTALKAGFPTEKIVLHGNNKSREELLFALKSKIGIIVLDNDFEAKLLMDLVDHNYIPNIMLRINPGIDAHTHEYIKTSTVDSKFGMSIHDPKTIEIIKILKNFPYVNFLGTHSHIGSQILEPSSFYDHAHTVLSFYKTLKDLSGVELECLNLGGGFGVKYMPLDQRLDLNVVLPKLLESIHQDAKKMGLKIPKVLIEPGRSIVAEAGYTLYTIDQIKTTLNKKHYMFIDGSMNDHIRTALYQAVYDAEIIGKTTSEKNILYTVAGKACESGDIIIHNILLPEAKVNDLLLVKTTGAYHYSMASHYNRLTIPPVVFVSKGQSKIIVRRETLNDLTSHDEVL